MADKKSLYVTIPIEEYKELLLRDKPTDNDHEIFERTLTEVAKRLKFTDSKYDSGYLFDNLKVSDAQQVVEEFMRMLKYTNRERYMEVWNAVMKEERERKAMADKANDMRKAKEIRSE